MDIQTAQNAALAAIARLADAGHRLANEHAYALDQLRQENEALRRQNQALRERLAELEHRCEHTAEVLANVQPVDTEAVTE
jgi:regulator of replication initiation timing